MNLPDKKRNGSVTVEYAIVTILLMIPLWYALMGGSGVWIDTDRAPNHGNLTESPPQEAPAPGLFKALDDRQHSFSSKLNQP